jgi:hypothetical protein
LLAFGLTIVLFAFWGLLGYALIRAIKPRLDPLQEMLLSPVVGMVVVMIAVFLLNRLGIPVGRFANPLTIGLVVAAGVPLVLGRRAMPWRPWLPFAGIFAGALLLCGWPMFEFGFDWVSLCNDDMANYCLGAVRFHDYGFFHTPSGGDLTAGRDYSHYYWFMHVPGRVRAGAELLLAWVMGVTRLTPHEAFMPTIFAFHLCQISATGALIHQSPQYRKPALAACALLSVSALASFGALYQLIAQVGGIAILAAVSAVSLRPLWARATAAGAGEGAPSDAAARDAGASEAPAPPLRRGLLGGIIGVGLFLYYPEVIPLAGVSWLLFLLFEALHRRVRVAPLLGFVGAAVVVIAALLGRHAIGALNFLFMQAASGSVGGVGHETLFPYYRIPSGLADFWGFFPLTDVPVEPWASLGVGIGGLLLIATVVVAAWLAWRGQPVAFVCVVMFALTSFLVYRGALFGLYKMAMFLQPFALGTVVVAAFVWMTRTRVRVAFLVALAIPSLYIQQVYVRGSRGTGAAGGFPEIVDPSRSRVNDDLVEVLEPHAAALRAAGVVCDVSNIVLGKFMAYGTRGAETAFPVTPVGTSLVHMRIVKRDEDRSDDPVAEALADVVAVHRPRYHFKLLDPASPRMTNPFDYLEMGPLAAGVPASTRPLTLPSSAPSTAPSREADAADVAPDALLHVVGPKQTVVNRRPSRKRLGPGADEVNFFVQPLARARDHLLFVESELGRSYYSTAREISIFQLEPDPTFLRHQTMAGMGRRFVFQVLQPSPGVRLMIEMTASLNSDASNDLPTAAHAIGTSRHALGITGRGSARVFSEPLEPQNIDGRSFVGLDMGRPAQPFREARHGLMLMYGRHILLDRRMLVGFVRDISAVSSRQYAALKPPARLEKFPDDFQHQDLEYSGFYEDGWTSDHCWAALGRPWDAGELVIQGYVPEVDKGFRTEMTVKVDGQEVGRAEVGEGSLDMRFPVPAPASQLQGAALPASNASGGAYPSPPARSRVELVFSRLQKLPDPDRRPVACLIKVLGFESPARPPTVVNTFPRDVDTSPLLAPAGLYADGWAAPRTTVTLTQPPDHSVLSIKGTVPRIGNDAFETTVRVSVDGQVVGEKTLGVGEFDWAVSLGTAAASQPGPRRVELVFSAGQTLPGGDARAVGALLSSLGFITPPLPPARVAAFPQDLRRPLLEANGLFEDGWAAGTASLRLGQPAETGTLVIAGTVPRIGQEQGFTTTLRVMVDGEQVGSRTLAPGDFRMELPVSEPTLSEGVARRVELRFSDVQTLPDGDGRAVGAKVSEIGFVGIGG